MLYRHWSRVMTGAPADRLSRKCRRTLGSDFRRAKELWVLGSRGSRVRFATVLAILVGVSSFAASDAAAKFGLHLSVSRKQPGIGQPVSVLIRTRPVGAGPCCMRLLAVAPGIDRYHALDAFVIGGYSVNGPF